MAGQTPLLAFGVLAQLWPISNFTIYFFAVVQVKKLKKGQSNKSEKPGVYAKKAGYFSSVLKNKEKS
jgi:hypothetical protein